MGEPILTPFRVYLGTKDGVRACRFTGDDLEPIARGIPDNAVRDIAVHPDDPSDCFIGCGLRGWGLYHTKDGGNTMVQLGFEDRWVWGVTRHPNEAETIFVGTEPPMLYRSTDNGTTFRSFDVIHDVHSRFRWKFFHDPFRSGHIHGIAIDRARPDHIYAGVEHGALIYSPDDGETWEDALVGSDLHRVGLHPSDPSHILAATGAGLYQSFDGGSAWRVTDDLEGSYLHSNSV